MNLFRSLPLGATAHLHGPTIYYPSFAPFLILAAGALVVLLLGLFGRTVRTRVVPVLTIITLAGAIVDEILRLNHPHSIISNVLAVDGLALVLDLIFAATGILAVLLSMRSSPAPGTAGRGEYYSLLLFSILGMAILVSAQDLITLFVGFELLSIPLYILCAAEYRREGSLESGLKYLVIGSVGSATLVYGLALVYGATGSTFFSQIASAISTHNLTGDPMLMTGLALVIVGFAFKASVAPFHQWTPDVYEGAPTPITAFMAVATKAAALGVFLRFFDVAAFPARTTWEPAIAVIAAITIIVGNVGALNQSSLKRMLGYSGVAQAGYLLAGVVVATKLGVEATILYLIFYLFMNLAAFAAIVGAQTVRADGDDLAGLQGLGARHPWLAWPMSVAMLSLAGIPGTVGFIGKFQLIHALVSTSYGWLAVVLVIGSMISLGYYLRVIAAMWMRSEVPSPGPGYTAAGDGRTSPRPRGLAPIAGGSPEADELADGGGDGGDGGGAGTSAAGEAGATLRPRLEAVVVAAVCAGASIGFGIFPSPLFRLASHAVQAIGLM